MQLVYKMKRSLADKWCFLFGCIKTSEAFDDQFKINIAAGGMYKLIEKLSENLNQWFKLNCEMTGHMVHQKLSVLL